MRLGRTTISTGSPKNGKPPQNSCSSIQKRFVSKTSVRGLEAKEYGKRQQQPQEGIKP